MRGNPWTSPIDLMSKVPLNVFGQWSEHVRKFSIIRVFTVSSFSTDPINKGGLEF